MDRHYRSEDGITGYDEGDVLINDDTGERSRVVRDGRGLALQPEPAPKTRTITLTGRRPVTIREDEWPSIAHGLYRDHDGQVESQTNRKWRVDIRVRQHADGRLIVYGSDSYQSQWQHERDRMNRAGYLLAATDDVSVAVQRVADDLIKAGGDEAHVQEAARDCIADLPAETI